jgi:cytochrome c oxidase subunit 2
VGNASAHAGTALAACKEIDPHMSPIESSCIRCSFVAATLLAAAVSQPASARPAGAQAAEPRVIEVVAKRYAFEPAEIEVTEGERVRLMVRSGDGLHGFEIKPLRVKKEIPRGGEAVPIEFTAEKAGRYPILCSEYCGDGHADMKGALVVVAREAGATP